MIDLLESEAVNSALAGTIFAGKVEIFPTVESTNSYAMRCAAAGAPHGTVYVAEEQTAGRGRGSHGWHSEPYAGLYLSVVLRPEMAPADALWISLASGVAVQTAIDNATALVADIRWPNDLLLNGRKFGGILTEMNAEATRVRYAVAGIGINVNHRQFPADIRDSATSLRLESDGAILRQDVLIAVLLAMNSELEPLMHAGSFAASTRRILTRIQECSTWICGKRVFVDEAEGYTGVTAGLDARGFLLIQTAAGTRTVLSGGVREAKG